MKTFKQHLKEAWWIPPLIFGADQLLDTLYGDDREISDTADDTGGPWNAPPHNIPGNIAPPGWYYDPEEEDGQDPDSGWQYRPNPGGSRHPDWYEWNERLREWVKTPKHKQYVPPKQNKDIWVNPQILGPRGEDVIRGRPGQYYQNPGLRAPLPGEMTPFNPSFYQPEQPGLVD